MDKIPQEDRPDRKVYHITPAGRTELLQWLSGPPPMDDPRSAPLIQVFFAQQQAIRPLSSFPEHRLALKQAEISLEPGSSYETQPSL